MIIIFLKFNQKNNFDKRQWFFSWSSKIELHCDIHNSLTKGKAAECGSCFCVRFSLLSYIKVNGCTKIEILEFHVRAWGEVMTPLPGNDTMLWSDSSWPPDHLTADSEGCSCLLSPPWLQGKHSEWLRLQEESWQKSVLQCSSSVLVCNCVRQ